MAVILRRSPFDRLPLDVVEHIFLKGCEMSEPDPEFKIRPTKSGSVYNGPIPRKLKPFALEIRSVCSKWKRMIDSEENFSLARYWFSRLVLVIPSYFKESPPNVGGRELANGGEKREKVFFAKQMLQFERQLTNTRGCDLQILLASSESLKDCFWKSGPWHFSPQDPESAQSHYQQPRAPLFRLS